MSQPPKDYPVTGLCVVADPGKCPPGYDLIFYSDDRKDDCDLWKDSIWKARVTRYLCITRVFPLDGGRLNNVLADVVVQNEKDIPPSGYTLVENTVDSSEKATRKKQICVKMLPRNSTNSAICELIILSKSKRAPTGYTIAGEINGFLLCFKFGTVPPSQITSPTSPSVTNAELNNSQNTDYFSNRPRSTVMSENHQGQAPPAPSQENNNRQHSHPLSGVPFQISPKYGAPGVSTAINATVHYRSLVDINSEYDYPFRLERSVFSNQNL